MFVAAVVVHRLTEEPDALIEQTAHHGLLRQLHHAVGSENRETVAPPARCTAAAGSRVDRRRERLGDFHVYVFRVRNDFLNERSRRVEAASAIDIASNG